MNRDPQSHLAVIFKLALTMLVGSNSLSSLPTPPFQTKKPILVEVRGADWEQVKEELELNGGRLGSGSLIC